jgi:HPt (histidine-containing phosphotransfer) domain-containing protein
VNPIEERMAALRARFATAAPAEAAELEYALEAGDADAMRRIAHGLAGRAGMFGFAALGAAALRADEASDAQLPKAARALLMALREVDQER